MSRGISIRAQLLRLVLAAALPLAALEAWNLYAAARWCEQRWYALRRSLITGYRACEPASSALWSGWSKA